jgi:AP2 domain
MSARTPTSGYKGVSFHQAGRKWWARIYSNSKQKSLGLYDTLEEAAEFYNKTRKEYLKTGESSPIIDKRRSGRPREHKP